MPTLLPCHTPPLPLPRPPRSERLYMGKMARHSEVLLQPGHKWNNAAFYNHTGAWAGRLGAW